MDEFFPLLGILGAVTIGAMSPGPSFVSSRYLSKRGGP